jgi:hypothetical protein
MLLVVYLKTHHQNARSWRCSVMFSSRSLRSYTFLSVLYLRAFVCDVKYSENFYCFGCEYLVFSTIWCKDYPLCCGIFFFYICQKKSVLWLLCPVLVIDCFYHTIWTTEAFQKCLTSDLGPAVSLLFLSNPGYYGCFSISLEV